AAQHRRRPRSTHRAASGGRECRRAVPTGYRTWLPNTFAPEGASRCRAVASGLLDRSAISIAALCKSARKLGMRPREVKDAGICGAPRRRRAAYRPIAVPLLSTPEREAANRPGRHGRKAMRMRIALMGVAFTAAAVGGLSAQERGEDYPTRQVNF